MLKLITYIVGTVTAVSVVAAIISCPAILIVFGVIFGTMYLMKI